MKVILNNLAVGFIAVLVLSFCFFVLTIIVIPIHEITNFSFLTSYLIVIFIIIVISLVSYFTNFIKRYLK